MEDGLEEVREEQIIATSFTQLPHPSFSLFISSSIHREHRRPQVGVGNTKVRRVAPASLDMPLRGPRFTLL